MKKITRIFVLIAMLLGSMHTAKASHIAAADIYYEYIGPLQYRINLVLYRDCLGIPLQATEFMSADALSCGLSIPGFQVDTAGTNDPLNGKFLDQLCPGVLSQCYNTSSQFPGYQYFHYAKIVNLPAVCTDWTFSWSTCCRNGAILNIAPNSICIDAVLNNVARPINSSPKLSILPIPYICINQPQSYLNGPVDPDLDSIVFTPTAPLGAIGCSPYTFLGGNTVTSPLPNTGTYIVDPSTGTADFTATALGNYVLAFKAEEYDKNTGVLLGSIMRDVQVAVLNCNAAPPLVLNLTNVVPAAALISQTPAVISICPTQTLSFDVQGSTTAATNIITTNSNNAISCPGSTYTSNPINGGNPVTGTFTWTPTGAQVGQHTLIISFTDSTCTSTQPIVLNSYKVVLINVLPGVDAGPDKFFCIGGDSVSLDATGPANVPAWLWEDQTSGSIPPNGMTMAGMITKNPMVAPTVTTTYVLHAGAQFACSAISDTLVTITVVPGAIMQYDNLHTICANDSVLLSGTSNGISPIPAATATFAWNPLSVNGTLVLSDSTIQNPWAKPLTSTTYMLHYVDGFGCKYTDTVLVDVTGAKPVLNSTSSDSIVCPKAPFELFANASAQKCGLSFFPCNSGYVTKNVGAGNIQQTQYSPYYNESWTRDYKMQMIYTAEELRTSGVTPGNLGSIAFNVLAKASDTLRNFKIQVGCTPLNDFAGSPLAFATGLSPVYAANKYYSNLGWNTHNFTTPYFWDGVSNIAVEICYNTDYNFFPNSDNIVSSNTLNPQVITMAQGFATGTNACNMAVNAPSISTVRPNTRFKNCESGTFTYSWSPAGTLDNSTDANPNSSGLLNTQVFTVTATSSTNPNCVSTDNVTVVVDNSNSIVATANPQILCEPGLTTLTGTPAGTAPKYECGEENVACVAPYNQYTVGINTNSNTSITPLNGNYKGERSQMIVTAAELAASGITQGKISEIALNVTSKQSISGFNLNIKMGCTTASSLASFVNTNELKQVYANTNYNTIVGWNPFVFQNEFVWDGTSNLIVEMCFNNTGFVSSDPVAYSIVANNQFYYQNSNFGGCDIPLVSGVTSPVTTPARPDVRFSICNVPVKPWQYIWTPPLYVYDSTAGVTTAYVNQTTTYTVATFGGNKCKVEDSVKVTLSTHDLYVTPADTTVCFGDRVLANSFPSGNAPSYAVQWTSVTGNASEFSCTNCLNPVITPMNNGLNIYVCTKTDSYGCTDMDTVKITTVPVPNVIITNGDSVTIKYGQELNLVATGATLYSWVPVWGTSNPNIANPVVSPAETTLYYVYGLNSFGCRNMDSILVKVDYSTSPFVPNGFTPNGDGKNDFFKVVNYTIQKVQEFRVFNRWGEEIFTANDNRGWDGTFKGKAQDPNVYFYSIKLATPDGKVTSMKGDFTLIR